MERCSICPCCRNWPHDDQGTEVYLNEVRGLKALPRVAPWHMHELHIVRGLFYFEILWYFGNRSRPAYFYFSREKNNPFEVPILIADEGGYSIIWKQSATSLSSTM